MGVWRDRLGPVWVWTRIVLLYWVAIPALWFAFVLLLVWVASLGGGTAEVSGSGGESYDWGAANEGPPGP